MNPFKLKKELLKKLESELNNDSSKSDIYYNNLTEDKLHNKGLLDTVSFFLTKEKKEKFKRKNKFLLYLLLASILLTIPLFFQFFTHVKFHIISFVSLILLTAINIQLIFGVIKWNGKIYKSIVIIKSISLIGFFMELEKGYYNEWLYIYPIILIAEIVLSFWLYKNLFPNYSWKGPKMNNNLIEFD